MANAFNLRNGTILLSTEAPGGLYNSVQLKKIAAICESETAIVKATEDQRLALFVKADQAQKVAAELKSCGLGIRNYQDGVHQPVACLGALCPEHEQDAMKTAMDLTKLLDKLVADAPLKIGINGCARCCVPCHTYDVSIVGEAEGYRISLGGKNSQIPEMAAFMAEGVPAAKLPELIKNVITIYKASAEPGENLQDVLNRAGVSEFIKALAPYSQDASAGDPFGTTDTSAAEADPVMAAGSDPGDDFGAEDLAVEDIATEATLAASGDDDLAALDDLEIDDGDLDIDPQGIQAAHGGLEDDVMISAEDAGSAAPKLKVNPSKGDLEDDLDLGDIDMDANTEVSVETAELGEEELIADDEVEIEDETPLKATPQTAARAQAAASEMDDLDMDMDGLDTASLVAETVGDDDLTETVGDDELAETIADEEAPELGEEDESQFEEKINQAIAEEEVSLDDPEADAISKERLAAIDMMGSDVTIAKKTDDLSGDTELDLTGMDTSSLGAGDNLDDGTEFGAVALDDLDQAALDDTAMEDMEDIDPASLEATIGTDDLDENMVEERLPIHAQDLITPPPSRLAPSATKATAATTTTARGMEFTGFDITPQGDLSLMFASGVTIGLNVQRLGAKPKTLSLGDKQVTVTPSGEGLLVEVDGIEVFYPLRKAA